jgi:hypothetical protein
MTDALDAGREYWKAQVDFLKHLTTLSVITAGGFTGLSRGALASDPSRHDLFSIYLAFGLLGSTLFLTISALLLASASLAECTSMTAHDIGDEKLIAALSPATALAA